MNAASRRAYGAVSRRSSGICEGCGEEAQQMHHRQYRSRGGQDVPENLLHLCQKCHGTAHAGDVGVRLGWAVHSWAVPENIPVHLHDGWYLLSGATRIPIRADEAAELMALHGIRTEVA